MSAEERLLSINYLNLLSTLEQATRCEHDDPIKSGDRGRIRNFGKALQGLLSKAFNRRDKEVGRVIDALGIAASGIREKESKLLRSIAKATTPGKGFSGDDTVTTFPSKVGTKEVVGRMVATVLGLHAENRHDPDVPNRIKESLERATENILSPVLTWNLIVDISREHQGHHAAILKAVRERVRVTGDDRHYAEISWAEGKTVLPTLLLLGAWTRVLSKTYDLSAKQIQSVLVSPMVEALEGLDIPSIRERLHPSMTEAFGWGEHASERTLAIELAKRKGASSARIDRRLSLLKAAASAEAMAWNALLQRDEPAAIEAIDRALDERSLNTLQAAGKAFWLSRHCFRRTVGGNFYEPSNNYCSMQDGKQPTECALLDRASANVVRLLDLAAEQPSTNPDQIALLRRFQTGFATNPRYWRGRDVLEKAQALVEAYANLDGRKEGLVRHFKARLAMQTWYTQHGEAKDFGLGLTNVLKAYHEIFEMSPSMTEMVDAEAPIHLFPEVFVLLTYELKDDVKVKDALEDVDLILKSNFGVYMDIDVEQAAILGGLKQSKSWSRILAKSNTAKAIG
jgi:hypothetical protein